MRQRGGGSVSNRRRHNRSILGVDSQRLRSYIDDRRPGSFYGSSSPVGNCRHCTALSDCRCPRN